MTQDAPPICRNCKHVYREFPYFWEYAKCRAPQNFYKKEGTLNLVSGKQEGEIMLAHLSFCSTHRSSVFEERCGPQGRWFEPK